MKPPTRYEELRWRLAAALEHLPGRVGSRVGSLAFTAPDVVYLFARVLGDRRVPRGQRGELIGAVIYILSPFDLVPESLFGPVGLVDDALVAARLLDTLLNRVDPEVIDEHWPGDPATLERIRDVAREGRKVFSFGFGFGVKQLVSRAVDRLKAAPRQIGEAR